MVEQASKEVSSLSLSLSRFPEKTIQESVARIGKKIAWKSLVKKVWRVDLEREREKKGWENPIGFLSEESEREKEEEEYP